jgi:voltage-gated potassium channel
MTLGHGRWRIVYELVMLGLALAVVALLPQPNRGAVLIANTAIWAVFVADYAIRLMVSTDRRQFVRRNVIDLIAILPLEFFRAVRLLRIARLLRLVRGFAVFRRFARTGRGILTTNGLGWVLTATAFVVLIASTAVSLVEPRLGSFGDAIWWSVVTATTVGYGDLSPATLAGRVVAVMLMLTGIGAIGMVTASLATYFLSEDRAANPEVEHIRQRLVDWEQLTAQERRRLAHMLIALTEADSATG